MRILAKAAQTIVARGGIVRPRSDKSQAGDAASLRGGADPVACSRSAWCLPFTTCAPLEDDPLQEVAPPRPVYSACYPCVPVS
ncbi:hypothetical protein FA13DRAFT_1730254 [Coprinellus micaceus]|uniref:Uncharacterized protein n=1 Tax=Coprinellus micaceus TaxID=71717 RepID=A0A4Y7TKC4_COPMI|nr:hypothetical protein FA13DRAFT_1730254 [Coprinellus micaceus]